uniref:Sulfotransferase domain-containing protein n=2 Tax=Octactis speculum TaxID=3111310 RepID=A0A7S2DGK1_9STRA|mmetsp:Transcript_48469/g.65993  ORF Transcript_48469/g.65993 Transcript_48469/m.65993 type:complete len:353 (+) Transcript_48469:98-1156(+)
MPKSATSVFFEEMAKSHPLVTSNCDGLKFKEPQWWTRNAEKRSLEAYLTQTYNSESCKKGHRRWLSAPGSSSSPYSKRFLSPLTQVAQSPGKIFMDGSVQLFWEPSLHGTVRHDILPPDVLRLVQPNARIIAILRDPTMRLWSEFTWFKGGGSSASVFANRSLRGMQLLERCHCTEIPCSPSNIQGIYRGESLVQGGEDCSSSGTTKSAIDKSRVAYGTRVWIGLYWVYAVEWLKVFPADQILLVETNSVWNNLPSTLARIHSFLGLPSKDDVHLPSQSASAPTLFASRTTPSATSFASKVKSGASSTMTYDTEVLLRRFYDPFNQALADLTGDRSFLWPAVPPPKRKEKSE